MSLSDYEDTLKSYINDDEKLVTYKWLSKEFEIHVNVAKDILKQYWEKYKNAEKIIATYLLVGQLKDGGIRVEVVKESNLNTAKNKFLKVDCEHLYSLQKSLEDLESLANIGGWDLRYSAIKCNDEYIRNDEEIEALRYIGNHKKEESKPVGSGKLTSNALDKQVPKQTDSSSKEKSKKVVDKKENTEKEKPKKKETTKEKGKEKEKEKTKEKEKEKERTKEKEKNEEKEKETEKPAESAEKKTSPSTKSNNNAKPNNKVSKKPVQSKQSGFNNLFGKVASKPQTASKSKENSDESDKEKCSSDTKEKEEKKITETKDKQSKNKEDKEDRKKKDKGSPVKENRNEQSKNKEDKEDRKKMDKGSPEKENRNEQSQEKSKPVSKTVSKTDTTNNKSKSKSKNDTRGKKRNRSQEKNSSSKRKRIVVMDSSEDESNKSNDEEEEEEPMEVEEERPQIVRKRSPSPPAEKRENGKRMVRKTIDKTFKDEDGFLVTKRCHVYEAVSDSEEPVEVKKEEPKSKPVEVKAKKQTTLMNFFKKS